MPSVCNGRGCLSPRNTPTAEKLATGILTDEQFQQLNGRYLAEQETLKEHTARLETELAKQQDELDNVGNFLAVVDRHLEVPGRMLEILREFVHHITVHERFSAYKKSFTHKRLTFPSIISE